MIAEQADLVIAVRDAIGQGRLGTPKFLRCVAVVSDSAHLQAQLDAVVGMTEDWFQAAHSSQYSFGDGDLYHTQMLKWQDGRGALITIGVDISVVATSIDIMLVGSRGTLYFDGLG